VSRLVNHTLIGCIKEAKVNFVVFQMENQTNSSGSSLASKGPAENEPPSSLDQSTPEAASGTAQGTPMGLPSPTTTNTLPPIQGINQTYGNDPSPLTIPPTSVESQAFRQRLSAMRVEYDVTDTGIMLSVPVTSEIPYAKNNNCNTYQEGYDSDGEVGPFFDAIANQKDDDDEEFDEDEHTPVLEEASSNNQQQENEVTPVVNSTDLQKMTAAQLKDELRKRNLAVNGRKEVLIQRLLAPAPPATSARRPIQQQQPAISGFAPNAAWSELKNSNERATEPNQQYSNLVGPTVPSGQAEAPKYNFEETFDRPPFTAVSSTVKLNTRGKPVHDRKGQVMFEEEIREHGRANLEWLKCNKLTSESKPSEWIDALLPIKRKKGDSPLTVAIEDWTTYTNLKAVLMNAGSTLYQGNFVPFTPLEIQRFLALYILQGLLPSPQIKMKFVPQSVDKINGNDMCYRVFGKNASTRHKTFKAFFTIQDPRKIVPSRSTHPNFKVDPFLRWIQVVSMNAFDMGKYISIDEQTIGFKGHHIDKLRINYKKEGDGFQCDTVCCDGYTYSFFMRNMPAPKKYLDKGLSPLHA
jgi:hypothetical protein